MTILIFQIIQHTPRSSNISTTADKGIQRQEHFVMRLKASFHTFMNSTGPVVIDIYKRYTYV